MNNIKNLHKSEQAVSAQLFFRGSEGAVRALQIQQNALLKEHITQTPALLLCVVGEVVYEDEQNKQYTLQCGDYVAIEPLVKHWVKAIVDSQLLLIK
ncbi:MAG: hypothetical protein JNM36_13855 [Chitinophagales bacterium]|jgi:quercetin dioxygenase-like cupin family protein|nr:hypothetical protein [Chitinophagales bacterium]HNI45004.1 hypothetical protein [Chitinophagales bacterium]